MGFDVQGAKQAGYSDAEIADYLANERGFDAKGARDSGYNDAEIISHLTLSGPQEQKKGEELLETENQWLDTLSGSQRILKAPETPSGVQEPSLLGGDEFALAREVVNSNPATQTLANVIPSGGRFLKNLAEYTGTMVFPWANPEKIQEMTKPVVGAVEKLIPGQQEDEKYADAVGKFFVERYGGWDNLANTIVTDPVGFAADLSGVLGIGSAATASKFPAVSKALGSVANVTDPVAIASSAVNNPAARYVANKATFNSLDKGVPFSDKRAQIRAGEELAAMREPVNPTQAAHERMRLNEVNDLRERIPNMPYPSYGQASGNMNVAAREQSLSRTGENMQRFTYNDAAINDAAIDNMLRNLGRGENLPTVTATKQDMGRGIAESVEQQRKVAKQGVDEAYAAIPDEAVESSGIKKAVDEIRSERDFLTDAEYPTSAINKVDKIFGKAKGKPQYKYSYEGGSQVVEPTSVEANFQELHALRKELGEAIRNAEVGANPNFALSRNLKKIKGAVDDAIEAAGESGALSGAYNEAKNAYVEYASKFKTGAVNDVLRKGKQITGLNVPDEQIAKKFWTPSGADDLNRAVGTKRATSAMREYAASEIMPFLEKGDIKGALKWMVKNKVQLSKYGLEGEIRGLIKGQVPASIRSKVESARINIRENPQMTVNQVQRLIKEYGPALKILYKDNPNALRSMMDYHKVLKVLVRNKAVSYSKGSNTVEKGTNAGMALDLATLGAISMGKGWIFSSARNIIRGFVDGPIKASQARIEKLLMDATFNPEIAEQLMNLAKNPRNKKAVEKINRWVGQGGRAAAQNLPPNILNRQQPEQEEEYFDAQ